MIPRGRLLTSGKLQKNWKNILRTPYQLYCTPPFRQEVLHPQQQTMQHHILARKAWVVGQAWRISAGRGLPRASACCARSDFNNLVLGPSGGRVGFSADQFLLGRSGRGRLKIW
ncbi:hypothetical protein ACET3Z_014720 [Daucus carota]